MMNARMARTTIVYLFLEEHTENRMPIGVTRRGNLFRVDVAVAVRKQLFLFHTEIADIYQFRSHFYYLAFCTKGDSRVNERHEGGRPE